MYRNRSVLSADHRYYRDHGLYDYPQRAWTSRLFQSAVLLIKRIPGLGQRMTRLLMKGRMRSYRQLVEG